MLAGRTEILKQLAGYQHYNDGSVANREFLHRRSNGTGTGVSIPLEPLNQVPRPSRLDRSILLPLLALSLSLFRH